MPENPDHFSAHSDQRKTVLKMGPKEGLVQTDPLSNVSAKHDLRISKNQKERALTDHEIYLSYYAVDHSRMAYKNKLF